MDCKHCWISAWQNGKYGIMCINCGEFRSG
jgi:hypothetical protein